MCETKDGIFIGEAWLRENELVVGVSHGHDLPEGHNCDWMGCGRWHVLARIPINGRDLMTLKKHHADRGALAATATKQKV